MSDCDPAWNGEGGADDQMLTAEGTSQSRPSNSGSPCPQTGAMHTVGARQNDPFLFRRRWLEANGADLVAPSSEVLPVVRNIGVSVPGVPIRPEGAG